MLRHRGSAGGTCLQCVTDGEHDKTACTSLPLGGVFPGRTELKPQCCRPTGLYCLITHAEWTQTGCVHEQQTNESPLDWTCYQHWVGSVPPDNTGSVKYSGGPGPGPTPLMNYRTPCNTSKKNRRTFRLPARIQFLVNPGLNLL